jgi:catechol 2,3-dioxygenase
VQVFHGASAPLGELNEIALRSPEPSRLAEFYAGALGYDFTRDGDGLVGAASGRRMRIVQGPARTLEFAAFSLADADQLADLRQRLSTAGVTSSLSNAAAFDGGPALRFLDPDGNGFAFGVTDPKGGAAADPAGRAARLQHIVFASRDAERWIRFFVEVVGFTVSDRVVDEAGKVRTAFLRCGHEHHNIAVFGAAENRLDHHCYEAGEWNLIRDWADHFASLRIPLKWGPGRHGPGNNLFLFVHDPDGNWVEISAELERVSPDRPVGDWPHEERTLNSWGMGMLRS